MGPFAVTRKQEPDLGPTGRTRPNSGADRAQPLLEVHNLWCGYGRHTALKGISFRVAPGEIIGVLGPNGAGKSTLLLAAGGILPQRSGEIRLLGSPLSQWKPKERARRMAALNQDCDVRLPFTCGEVVLMGRYPHQEFFRTNGIRDATAVQWALDHTDTTELADRLITEVSGGERQSVIMARALAQQAPLLLLDEATSAMDIHRKLKIFQGLERLNREENLTILAALHDVNLAALFCRQLIMLKNGEILADGETRSVLRPEILENVYGTPAVIQEIKEIERLQVFFLPSGETSKGNGDG